MQYIKIHKLCSLLIAVLGLMIIVNAGVNVIAHAAPQSDCIDAVNCVQPTYDPVLSSKQGCQVDAKTKCDFIGHYINPAIKFLSAIVGIIVTGGIIYGGIEYASSGGDPQRVSKAKKRMMNAVFALLAYIFLFSMLNFLIPGGI